MGKKVKGSGFHFGDPVEENETSMAAFYSWLSTKNGTTSWPFDKNRIAAQSKAGEITRQVYFNDTTAVFCGLVITSSNDKHEHYLEERDGKTFVVQREIKDAPPVQLNFFAIRKDFNNGLYSHHRGSYPFGSFLKDLWWSYRTFVREVSSEDKTYSTFKHENTGPLYTRDGFDKLLRQFKRVNEVRVMVPEILQPDDAPESPSAEGSSIAIRFEALHPTSKVIKWISWLRDKSTTKRPHGSVIGIDNDDEPLIVDFYKTLEDHLSWPYEAIGDVDTTSIIEHDITKRLVKCLNENALFTTKVSRRRQKI